MTKIRIIGKKTNPYSKGIFDDGGFEINALKSGYGANFGNMLTSFNTGYSHLENPHEGILVGKDNQGTPNLVEEGELIWNGLKNLGGEISNNPYVFSNRLMPSAFMINGVSASSHKRNKQLDKIVSKNMNFKRNESGEGGVPGDKERISKDNSLPTSSLELENFRAYLEENGVTDKEKQDRLIQYLQLLILGLGTDNLDVSNEDKLLVLDYVDNGSDIQLYGDDSELYSDLQTEQHGNGGMSATRLNDIEISSEKIEEIKNNYLNIIKSGDRRALTNYMLKILNIKAKCDFAQRRKIDDAIAYIDLKARIEGFGQHSNARQEYYDTSNDLESYKAKNGGKLSSKGRRLINMILNAKKNPSLRDAVLTAFLNLDRAELMQLQPYITAMKNGGPIKHDDGDLIYQENPQLEVLDPNLEAIELSLVTEQLDQLNLSDSDELILQLIELLLLLILENPLMINDQLLMQLVMEQIKQASDLLSPEGRLQLLEMMLLFSLLLEASLHSQLQQIPLELADLLQVPLQEELQLFAEGDDMQLPDLSMQLELIPVDLSLEQITELDQELPLLDLNQSNDEQILSLILQILLQILDDPSLINDRQTLDLMSALINLLAKGLSPEGRLLLQLIMLQFYLLVLQIRLLQAQTPLDTELQPLELQLEQVPSDLEQIPLELMQLELLLEDPAALLLYMSNGGRLYPNGGLPLLNNDLQILLQILQILSLILQNPDIMQDLNQALQLGLLIQQMASLLSPEGLLLFLLMIQQFQLLMLLGLELMLNTELLDTELLDPLLNTELGELLTLLDLQILQLIQLVLELILLNPLILQDLNLMQLLQLLIQLAASLLSDAGKLALLLMILQFLLLLQLSLGLNPLMLQNLPGNPQNNQLQAPGDPYIDTLNRYTATALQLRQMDQLEEQLRLQLALLLLQLAQLQQLGGGLMAEGGNLYPEGGEPQLNPLDLQILLLIQQIALSGDPNALLLVEQLVLLLSPLGLQYLMLMMQGLQQQDPNLQLQLQDQLLDLTGLQAEELFDLLREQGKEPELYNKTELGGKSFADVVKEISKEYEERPNDPISKRTLDSLLSDLADELEMIREMKHKELADNAILSMDPLKKQEFLLLVQLLFGQNLLLDANQELLPLLELLVDLAGMNPLDKEMIDLILLLLGIDPNSLSPEEYQQAALQIAQAILLQQLQDSDMQLPQELQVASEGGIFKNRYAEGEPDSQLILIQKYIAEELSKSKYPLDLILLEIDDLVKKLKKLKNPELFNNILVKFAKKHNIDNVNFATNVITLTYPLGKAPKVEDGKIMPANTSVFQNALITTRTALLPVAKTVTNTASKIVDGATNIFDLAITKAKGIFKKLEPQKESIDWKSYFPGISKSLGNKNIYDVLSGLGITIDEKNGSYTGLDGKKYRLKNLWNTVNQVLGAPEGTKWDNTKTLSPELQLMIYNHAFTNLSFANAGLNISMDNNSFVGSNKLFSNLKRSINDVAPGELYLSVDGSQLMVKGASGLRGYRVTDDNGNISISNLVDKAGLNQLDVHNIISMVRKGEYTSSDSYTNRKKYGDRKTYSKDNIASAEDIAERKKLAQEEIDAYSKTEGAKGVRTFDESKADGYGLTVGNLGVFYEDPLHKGTYSREKKDGWNLVLIDSNAGFLDGNEFSNGLSGKYNNKEWLFRTDKDGIKDYKYTVSTDEDDPEHPGLKKRQEKTLKQRFSRGWNLETLEIFKAFDSVGDYGTLSPYYEALKLWIRNYNGGQLGSSKEKGKEVRPSSKFVDLLNCFNEIDNAGNGDISGLLKKLKEACKKQILHLKIYSGLKDKDGNVKPDYVKIDTDEDMYATYHINPKDFSDFEKVRFDYGDKTIYGSMDEDKKKKRKRKENYTPGILGRYIHLDNNNINRGYIFHKKRSDPKAKDLPEYITLELYTSNPKMKAYYDKYYDTKHRDYNTISEEDWKKLPEEELNAYGMILNRFGNGLIDLYNNIKMAGVELNWNGHRVDTDLEHPDQSIYGGNFSLESPELKYDPKSNSFVLQVVYNENIDVYDDGDRYVKLTDDDKKNGEYEKTNKSEDIIYKNEPGLKGKYVIWKKKETPVEPEKKKVHVKPPFNQYRTYGAAADATTIIPAIGTLLLPVNHDASTMMAYNPYINVAYATNNHHYNPVVVTPPDYYNLDALINGLTTNAIRSMSNIGGTTGLIAMNIGSTLGNALTKRLENRLKMYEQYNKDLNNGIIVNSNLLAKNDEQDLQLSEFNTLAHNSAAATLGLLRNQNQIAAALLYYNELKDDGNSKWTALKAISSRLDGILKWKWERDMVKNMYENDYLPYQGSDGSIKYTYNGPLLKYSSVSSNVQSDPTVTNRPVYIYPYLRWADKYNITTQLKKAEEEEALKKAEEKANKNKSAGSYGGKLRRLGWSFF